MGKRRRRRRLLLFLQAPPPNVRSVFSFTVDQNELLFSPLLLSATTHGHRGPPSLD